jgi:predicted ribosomally synthesized peptide with SipW-like signal peptide
VNCDDKIDCTKDTCDKVKGCIHAPNDLYCDTPDPCQNLTCSLTKGCVPVNVTCPPTGYVCIEAVCIPYQGCANQSRPCPSSNETCTFSGCVEDKNKPCKIETLKCAAIVDTAVIAATTAAISAALIAGIICGVVVLGGVAGGATFAYYNSQEDSGMTSVMNNPLFVDAGTSGTNPLSAV